MRKIITCMPPGQDAEVLEQSLRSAGVERTVWTLGEDVLSDNGGVDYVFADIGLLEQAFQSVSAGLQEIWNRFASAEVIVMVTPKQIRQAVDAVKAGAADYLSYPLTDEEIKLVLERTRDSFILQSELDYLRDHFWQDDARDVVGTASPIMREVFSKVRHVAGTRTTVLLTGETGTGKSLIARIIHNHSARSGKQFISVHCGAIADTLTESELFGHERGAFTGAIRRKPGKFELAEGGSIFLDEIGTVSQSTQIKLLQVVQDRVFQRVGGDTDIRADVRIIVATNEDLRELSSRGMFRKDLYYRLNVFPIHIPPLRERPEDILRLAEMFIERSNIQLRKSIRGLHPRVLTACMRYEWPGNVRELENLIERACILEETDVLQPESFPCEFLGADRGEARMPVDTSLTITQARRDAVEHFERQYLTKLLAKCKGRVKETALCAGITTRQLNKLMTRHGLDRKTFK